MGLNLLEGFDIAGETAGPGSASLIHLQAEAIKVSKADIYQHVGDPAFHATPFDALVSKSYAAARRNLINLDAALTTTVPAGDPSSHPLPPVVGAPTTANAAAGISSSSGGRGTRQRSERYYDSPDTTSFSVLDGGGNCVCW